MGDPTRPTRPIGQPEPPPAGRVVRERETVVGEDPLLEELRRVRFWSYFASAVGVAASILAVIALIVALGNDNNDNNSNAATSAEVSALHSDVSAAKADAARARLHRPGHLRQARLAHEPGARSWRRRRRTRPRSRTTSPRSSRT